MVHYRGNYRKRGDKIRMQIIMLNGGLGNQMFQYIFALYLAQKNAHVVLEDSAFFDAHVEPDLFKIPKFFPAGIFPRLSEYFSPDVWEEMLLLKERGKSMIEQLYEGGLPIHYVQEMNSAGPSCAAPTTIIKKDAPAVSVNLSHEQTVYFWGYWITDFYFREIQDTFLSQFHFPSFPTTAQEEMARRICSFQNAAAIHVRRGDMAKLGRSNPLQYFRQAIRKLESLIHIDHFYLFSDDLPYCMNHAKELGLASIRSRLTVVDGNRGAHDYVDMQLMSLCRFRIIDQSSFSFLAGLLCRLPGNLTIFYDASKLSGCSFSI